jgi:hypothetical protein
MQTMWVTWKHKMRSFVFDHKELGIVDEPFVLQSSLRLKELLREISDVALHNAVNYGFRLTISAKEIPSAFKATLVKHEDDGAWYRFENGKQGWFGPIFETILREFPIVLYLRLDLE